MDKKRPYERLSDNVILTEMRVHELAIQVARQGQAQTIEYSWKYYLDLREEAILRGLLKSEKN